MTDQPLALQIENLSFAYKGGGDASWTLRIDDMSLARADQALLTGGSGTGKSTLLHLICGLMEPDAGRIIVNGQCIHELNGAVRDLFRGRAVGMIFQDFNLLNGFTAIENVMIALMFSDVPKSEHRERAGALLKRLGLDSPDRLVDRLSIGQQQRVAVARAVACEPVLVLADEPTASLDPQNADAAMELIQETCKDLGASLLCVSHDPRLPERFERVHDLSELVTPSAMETSS